MICIVEDCSATGRLLIASAVLADELVDVLDVESLGLLRGVVLDLLPGVVELLLLYPYPTR